jgi:hypothetical protein
VHRYTQITLQVLDEDTTINAVIEECPEAIGPCHQQRFRSR